MRKPKKQYAIARPYVPVGEYLAKMRAKAGLTQRAVAEKLGYSSAQFISNFECGMSLPPLRKLKLMIEIYDADPNTLLRLVMAAESALFLAAVKPEKRARA